MKKILTCLKKDYAYRIYVLIAIFLIYMAIFQSKIVTEFLSFLFLDAGKQLITNIVNNGQFITVVVGAIVWGVGHYRHKSKNKQDESDE